MDVAISSAPKPAETIQTTAHLSPWQLFWQRLRRRRIAMVGGVILIVLYLMALLAGFIAPYSYERQDRDRVFHRPTVLRVESCRLMGARYQRVAGQFKYR